MKSAFPKLLGAVLLCGSLSVQSVQAADLHVMNSGGFTAAYKLLAPKFEAKSGDTLNIAYGPSMGNSPEAIPNRLARNEPADVVIMVGYALDKLIAEGKVIPGSRVELADSRIGMAVRAGEPKPDIGSVESFRKTLLEAKSVAYSDSASGVYIQNELFEKMGIEAQMKPKATMIPKIPVGSVVAKGDYQLGFQQVSELLPVPGIEFVGKIPEPLQSVTRYAAGIPVSSAHPREAKALLEFLASPEAAPDVASTGLDPLATK
jgi:molybdate transport system substrate-binding protein